MISGRIIFGSWLSMLRHVGYTRCATWIPQTRSNLKSIAQLCFISPWDPLSLNANGTPRLDNIQFNQLLFVQLQHDIRNLNVLFSCILYRHLENDVFLMIGNCLLADAFHQLAHSADRSLARHWGSSVLLMMLT